MKKNNQNRENNSKKQELQARLEKIKLPLVIIDNKWYELIPENKKTTSIKNLEKKLKDLLLKQANLMEASKGLLKEKKKLMASFIDGDIDGINAVNSNKENEKGVLDKYKDKIPQINAELEKNKEKLEEIPRLIDETNEELVLESMLLLDDILVKNEKDISDINDYIVKIKEEVKKKMLIKIDKEQKNKKIYAYMHDVLGAMVMEEFDGASEYKRNNPDSKAKE